MEIRRDIKKKEREREKKKRIVREIRGVNLNDSLLINSNIIFELVQVNDSGIFLSLSLSQSGSS